jgi:hypothetical protein
MKKVEYYRYPVFGALFGWSLMLLALIVPAMFESHVSIQKVLALGMIFSGILFFWTKLFPWAFAYELGMGDVQKTKVLLKGVDLDWASRQRVLLAMRMSGGSSGGGPITFVQAYFHLLNRDVQRKIGCSLTEAA